MRNLQRKLNHGSKLQEYLGIKGQRRILLDLEQRDEAKRKAELEFKENQLNQYKDLLQRITEFCGEEDIERLAVQFKRQEADNFSLFSYITELNREIDGITDRILKLKSDVDAERDLTAWRKEHEIQRILELEAKLEDTRIEADKEEKRMNEYQDQLGVLLNGVKEIFTMIETNDEPIMCLLGDTTEVTLNNVMLYLKLIECRTNEIMQMVYFIENGGADLPEFQLLKVDESSEVVSASYENVNIEELDGEEDVYAEEEIADIGGYQIEEPPAADDETAEAVQGLEVDLGEQLGEEEEQTKEDDEALGLVDVNIGRSTEILRVTYGDEEKKRKIIRETVRPRLRPEPVDRLTYTQPCPLCVEAEEIDFSRLEEEVQPYTREEIKEKLKERMQLPDIANRLHNVSNCKLPDSRKVLQKRYQTT